MLSYVLKLYASVINDYLCVLKLLTMKLKEKVLSVLFAASAVWGLAGCAEDRTYEYMEKTSEARWVESAVQEWYLWADSMPEVGWKDYFSGSEAFLKKLTSKIHSADKWSHSEVDSLTKDYHARGGFDHLDSYGLDAVLMTDPTGNTSRQFVRVKTVYPGSPAERCGLVRNDFITHINGQKVSSSNLANLTSGLSRTLVRCRLGYSVEEQVFFWNEADTVEMEASEYVEDVAFPLNCVYDINGYKVGYLMCNRLVAGAHEKGSAAGEYRAALDDIMARMKGEAVSALVLDLRLCNYGEMDMVRRLATYVAGAKDLSLLQTVWKESKAGCNESVDFEQSVASSSLALERVYVITSGYTQGAAEWLVQGLKGVLGEENVFTFGTKTAGQNVMLHPVASASGDVTLHLAAAYVADCNGEYGYDGGHVPMAEIDECSFAELYPYGSLDEVVLAEVIARMIPLEGFY